MKALHSHRRWCLAIGLLLAAPSLHAADAHETAALHALFAREWERSAARFPESSSLRGDLRFNDRLGDESEAAMAAYDDFERRCLREARAIRRERLSPADRVSLDLFIAALQRDVEEQDHEGYRSLLLGTPRGAQNDFAALAGSVPMHTAQQARDLLSRMAALPRLMEQRIERLRRGARLGWVTARPVLERVLAQIDAQLPPDAAAGPFFAPFAQLDAAIPEHERERLRQAALDAIGRHVAPALRRLRDFVRDEYLAQAPDDGAMAGYPDGAQVYEMLVRHRTTTRLTPREIHALGQRELAAIEAGMQRLVAREGFSGSVAQYAAHLRADARLFHASPEEMLKGYRDLAKRIDAELPRLFAELPRAPYGVRAMPAFLGPNAAEYYEAPSQDGRRAGYVNANTAAWRSRPRWAMATILAHEGAPGHHIQVARAQELQGLPPFRRAFGNAAFSEGWAVYAETLGREIGLYDEPHSLFGHLQYQALRAARLVVDTGLHAMGWTRRQAIDFMAAHTGLDEAFLVQEVDRYAAWPAQALAYAVGQLKIRELRERAAARLGARFDLRRFHQAVLDQGAVPLDLLERLVDAWIEAER